MIEQYNIEQDEYKIKMLYPRDWLSTNFYTGWFADRYLIKHEITEDQLVRWIEANLEE